MLEQLALFSQPPRAAARVEAPPRARSDDPATSQLAAARVGEFAGEHYRVILKALAQGNGTIYEIADRAGMTHVQVARRLPELKNEDQVEVIPLQRRPSPSGRSCQVWRLTP